MAWLWTDTLAALLVEHDHVPQESVSAWVARPSAYRLPDGDDPLTLARRLLAGEEGVNGTGEAPIVVPPPPTP